jgi:hypothetical protein
VNRRVDQKGSLVPLKKVWPKIHIMKKKEVTKEKALVKH